MNEVDPAATLLQLSLGGINSMTDWVTTLKTNEHDVCHQLRHLDLRADDFVARPSEDDLASLLGEGDAPRSRARCRPSSAKAACNELALGT